MFRKLSSATLAAPQITQERGLVGCFPLRCNYNPPFSHVHDNTLDVEGHGGAEMIPVLFDNGGEPRLPGSMIFMRDPKVLTILHLSFEISLFL